jgi:transcriptional regulatory protein LevR
MSFNKVGTQRTICEVLREINDITDDPKIIIKLEEATHMAKRMSNKLTEYNSLWKQGFFEPNTDVKNKTKIRQ